MGAHVVGVAVATGGVVGDDDVGAHLVDHRAHGCRGVGEVGPGPGARVRGGGGARHPRVAVRRGLAPVGRAEHVVGRPERLHRAAQLRAAVGGERVAGRALEVGQVGGDDLALLPQGAGEHVHVVAAGHVVGDGHPGGERLVVGVGVHEEQPRRPALDRDAVEQPGHRTTAMSANSTTPPATVLADRLRTSEPAT